MKLPSVTADLLSSHENERKCEWVFVRKCVFSGLKGKSASIYLSILLRCSLSSAPSFSLSPVLTASPLLFAHPFGLHSFPVSSQILRFANFLKKKKNISPPLYCAWPTHPIPATLRPLLLLSCAHLFNPSAVLHHSIICLFSPVFLPLFQSAISLI